MPQLCLPIFPAEFTQINDHIGFECKDGKVVYVNGFLPICQHAKEDLKAFRLYTSQWIDTGTVRAVEVARVFQISLGTVKRYVSLYRREGGKGFYAPVKRRSSSVVRGETAEKAQALLDESKGVAEVAREVGVLANTLHKAIRAGRLRVTKKKS